MRGRTPGCLLRCCGQVGVQGDTGGWPGGDMEPPEGSNLSGAGPSCSQVKIANPGEELPREAGPHRPHQEPTLQPVPSRPGTLGMSITPQVPGSPMGTVGGGLEASPADQESGQGRKSAMWETSLEHIWTSPRSQAPHLQLRENAKGPLGHRSLTHSAWSAPRLPSTVGPHVP